MGFGDNWPVVREGVYQYAGSVPVGVRVLLSDMFLGSGDHEDDISIRENRREECYFIAYEAAGSPGTLSNLIPNFPPIEAAIALAENRFPGIRWQP
jgi:hypothetical protein